MAQNLSQATSHMYAVGARASMSTVAATKDAWFTPWTAHRF